MSANDRSQRNDRHGGMLYPLLLAAAVAVIVFSIIGIATMAGVVPNATNRDANGRHGAADVNRKPARVEVPQRNPGLRHGDPRSALNGAAWYPSGHA
ncbi:MAG: hypothetical protein ACT4PS_13160 [Betaproteobacteria bacterium]